MDSTIGNNRVPSRDSIESNASRYSIRMDVGLSATHTGSHVRRLASKYSEEASTTRIMDPASAAVGIYVLARSTNYVEGQLHRALMRSITELLVGRRRLGGLLRRKYGATIDLH